MVSSLRAIAAPGRRQGRHCARLGHGRVRGSAVPSCSDASDSVRTNSRMFGEPRLLRATMCSSTLIIADRLYLQGRRPDPTHASPAAGCEPFVYGAKGRRVSLGYSTAPEGAMRVAGSDAALGAAGVRRRAARPCRQGHFGAPQAAAPRPKAAAKKSSRSLAKPARRRRLRPGLELRTSAGVAGPDVRARRVASARSAAGRRAAAGGRRASPCACHPDTAVEHDQITEALITHRGSGRQAVRAQLYANGASNAIHHESFTAAMT